MEGRPGHSFFADPDPSVFLNADPDPDPGGKIMRIHADPDSVPA